MSDPSLSPVELIAEALRQHWSNGVLTYPQRLASCTCGLFMVDHEKHVAEVIAAAVRSWPAPTQAQLVGGTLRTHAKSYCGLDGWRDTQSIDLGPVPAQLIGDTE